MSGIKLTWTKKPEVLSQSFENLMARTTGNMDRVVADTARDAQNRMRQNRPWLDQTGNARRGLVARPSAEGNKLAITFVHSVSYGVFLELSRSGRYAVIVPEMYETIDKLRRNLQGAMK